MSYLYLNTKDCIDPTEPHIALFQIQGSINEFNVSKLVLEAVDLNNAQYPINRYNNTLVFEEKSAASTVTLTIDPNLYTGTQMASYLTTQMTAQSLQGNTYSVSYDSQSKKLTFDVTPNNFRITSASTCLSELGFPSTGMGSAVLLKTSDYVVNLNGSKYIDVISNLSNRSFSSDQKSNRLVRIPISVGFGELISYQSQSSDNYIRIGNNADMSNLELRLLDDKGNPYVINPNNPISYVFSIKQ